MRININYLGTAFFLLFFTVVSSAKASDFPMSPIQFPSSFEVNVMNQIGETYDSNNDFESNRSTIQSIDKGVLKSSSSYKVSLSNRKKNLDSIVNKTRANSPKDADALAKIFASTDIIDDVGKGIAPYGLKTNNVADAYAVYWMTAWQAAHGDTSDFTTSQSQAVKQQAANALLATAEFVSATDAIKQEMAEAYLVQAALIQASVDVAQTDRTIAKGLPSAVRKGAKASGLDLDAMTLTDEGFVPAQ